MQVTDPIADLLTRIRNGQKAGHDLVSIPASKMKIAITHILKEEGFIRNYKCIRDKQQGLIKIALRYRDDGKGTILGIDRVSRPGRRLYVRSDSLPYVKSGVGVGIISTSRGLMTDRKARQEKLGGEYVCAVY